MSRHHDDDDDSAELPMTEAQWEKMMRESDLRAARFGELLETLIDHPNRNEVVAREMGWNELADAMAQQERDGDEEFDADLQIAKEEFNSDEDQQDSEHADYHLERDEHDRELQAIPAYVLSERAAEAIRHVIQPHLDNEAKLDEEQGMLVSQAYIGFHIACAKISGGHAMGYEDDVLGGNIVNNKRGLDGARQAIDAVEQLGQQGIIESKLVQQLQPIMSQAREALESRIETLRGRMWWESNPR